MLKKIYLKIWISCISCVFASFLFAQNPIDSLKPVILYSSSMKPHVACYRIPAIIEAPNGDLIAAADERVPSCGDLRHNRDINIVIRRSFDQGINWTEMETLVDYPIGQSVSDPSLIVDEQNGTIFMFYNVMDLDKEKDVYYFHYIQSIDNGNSWSAPVDITTQIAPAEWHRHFKFITSGRGVQSESGMLLHTLVNLEEGLFVFGSSDGGKNWKLFGNAIQPADESKIVVLNDGSWMVNSRVNGAGIRYVHLSKDQGQRWETIADSSLPDPGCNASILKYTANSPTYDFLVFANANSPDKRENLSLRISTDEGNTWSVGKTIDGGPSAYVSMCKLSNGNLGLLYEKDDYSELVFISLPINWITEH